MPTIPITEHPKNEKERRAGEKNYSTTCTKTKTHIVIRIRREVVDHITIGGWAQVGEAARQAERDLPDV